MLVYKICGAPGASSAMKAGCVIEMLSSLVLQLYRFKFTLRPAIMGSGEKSTLFTLRARTFCIILNQQGSDLKSNNKTQKVWKKKFTLQKVTVFTYIFLKNFFFFLSISLQKLNKFEASSVVIFQVLHPLFCFSNILCLLVHKQVK